MVPMSATNREDGVGDYGYGYASHKGDDGTDAHGRCLREITWYEDDSTDVAYDHSHGWDKTVVIAL